jgi:hypothetical protein
MNELFQWAAIVALAVWLSRLQVGTAASNLVALLAMAGRGIDAIVKYLGGKMP